MVTDAGSASEDVNTEISAGLFKTAGAKFDNTTVTALSCGPSVDRSTFTVPACHLISVRFCYP